MAQKKAALAGDGPTWKCPKASLPAAAVQSPPAGRGDR